MRVINPYSSVDWDTVGHRIGQLHVHPNYSNKGEPADVIDAYHDVGYEILSVSPRTRLADTDGNFAEPWPWTDMVPKEIDPESTNQDDPDPWTENRDPEELGMIAVRGVETINNEHIFWYFSSRNYIDSSRPRTQFSEIREALENENALTDLAHPGRYNESDTRGDWSPGEWERYARQFRDFDRHFGIEVVNSTLGNDDSRILWDQLLTNITPHRNVIGAATDDPTDLSKEADNRFDSGRTVFLMDDDEFVPGHESGDIWRVWTEGQSYFSAVADNDNEHPTIENVEHDKEAATLTVEPSPVDHEKWIADGEVIHEGQTLEYEAHSDEIDGYVRFEGVVGDDTQPTDENHPPESVVCTQPFITTGTILSAQR